MPIEMTCWPDLAVRTLEDVHLEGSVLEARPRYRLSEWSSDGGFAHGADVLPAVRHLAETSLPAGVTLKQLDVVRFRKIIFEQLTLRAGGDAPSDADLLATWSTSEGRRASVWGRFDGRPLDRDVLFARNPLVFSRVKEPLVARTDGLVLEWDVDALDVAHHARAREEGPAGELSAFLDHVGFMSRMAKAAGFANPEAYFLIAGLEDWVTPGGDVLTDRSIMRADPAWHAAKRTSSGTWLLPVRMTWRRPGMAEPEGGGTMTLAHDDVALTFAGDWLRAASTT